MTVGHLGFVNYPAYSYKSSLISSWPSMAADRQGAISMVENDRSICSNWPRCSGANPALSTFLYRRRASERTFDRDEERYMVS